LKAFEEAISRAEVTDIKEKPKAGEPIDKKKIAARLDSLAKMYDAKKTKKDKKKTAADDAEEVEE
jgi:hypothetical protein